MESRPEIVEISLVKDETVLTSYASGFAFEALSLPAGQKLAMQDTLETLKRAHDSETALFSNPYFYKGNSTPISISLFRRLIMRQSSPAFRLRASCIR